MKTFRNQFAVWAAALTVACTCTMTMAADKEKDGKEADVTQKQRDKEHRQLVQISEELPAKLFRATDLIGLNVNNSSKTKLGDIENIVLHLGQGHVDYLILAHGEILELGGERYAVPLGAFQAMQKEDTTWLELNVTEEQLAAAPQLKGDKWPAITEYKWLGTVYTFGYRANDGQSETEPGHQDAGTGKGNLPRKEGKTGTPKKVQQDSDDVRSSNDPQPANSKKPSDQAADDQKQLARNPNQERAGDSERRNESAVVFPLEVTVVFSTELTGQLSKFEDFKGRDVQTSDGKSAGSIADIVIDQTNGRIAYAVVSRGGFLGVGSEYVAVPMNAFTAQHTEDDGAFLKIAATQAQFKTETALGEKNWPATARVGFIKSDSRKEAASEGPLKKRQKTGSKSNGNNATRIE